MHQRLRDLAPQPLIGAASVGVASLAFLWVWTHSAHQAAGAQAGATVMLSLFLAGTLTLSYHFPIHLRASSKVYIGSTVLYLIAVLLPPALAAAVAAWGVFLGEVTERHRTGNLPSDIATDIGRLTVVVLAGSLVSHFLLGGSQHTLIVLGATAIVLWAGDLLTVPLLVSPLTGERPAHVIALGFRDGVKMEGAQYLVGVVAALEAVHQAWTLALFVPPMALVYLTFKHAKEMQDQTRQMLEGMADAVDLRDPYTGGHSRRVTEYAKGILRELDIRGPEAELVVAAARVHDIGKMAIPDGLLKKPGALTQDERDLMETHVERGAEVVSRYKDFAGGVAIVRHHHESWDGTGYPHRLKGRDIPFGARVVAVADSYDAMTSDRPYRSGMSADRAAAVLRDGRGKQWDPAIVDAFLRSTAQILEEPVRPALTLVPPDGAAEGASA